MAKTGPDPASAGVSEPRDPAETAAYIARATHELATAARRSRLEIIAYLLEMVQSEASAFMARQRRPVPPPPGP